MCVYIYIFDKTLFDRSFDIFDSCIKVFLFFFHISIRKSFFSKDSGTSGKEKRKRSRKKKKEKERKKERKSRVKFYFR